MTPEELHRDLTNAFYWPWVELVKLRIPRGGGKNRKIMQFKPMTGGSAMKIQQMRDSVSQFAKGLEKIDFPPSKFPETGYYFKGNEYASVASMRYKEIESIIYYDKDTKIITLCNLNPAIREKELNGKVGEYFFFNEYPAKNLLLGEIPPITTLGNYYSQKLPNQYNFINWVSNPFKVKL
jgi:hypothetical protein